MIENENTAVIISTHMTAPSLPGAAMADLLGEPMVVHAWRTAKNANIGDVLVAAPSMAVAQAIQKAGGDVILVGKSAQKPLAQAAEALSLRDPDQQFSHVLVIPANYPLLDTLTLRRCLAALINDGVDLATAAGQPPSPPWEPAIPNSFSVKAPLEGEREVAFARSFGRNVGEGDWHHINITALRRKTLDQFKSSSDPETLDVATALQHGLKIAVVKVDDQALYINTPLALDLARRSSKDKS
jgi:3-deoxy-manno-octulosonate cytidylyltransferase (CMP-KDO synthetase)